MNLKVGDRVYFNTRNTYGRNSYNGFGVIRKQRPVSGFYVNTDDKSILGSGSVVIAIEEGAEIVHEDVYYSPLYKALR